MTATQDHAAAPGPTAAQDHAAAPGSPAPAPGSPVDVDALELRLGDPLDPRNPVGHAAVLAADEAGHPLRAGEALLDDYGFNAEFVPRRLGGRFTTVDRLAQQARALARRDCTMGLAYGITNYISGAPIWTDGSPEQQRWAADTLLDGRRISAGYTELPHGNDFTRNELTARRVGDHYLVSGRKELINNISRADGLLLFARTDEAPGSRSHTHLLIDLAAIPQDRFRYLPRFTTAGVRGCRLAGIEFRDCPVPASAVVGEAGGAMEAVLRAFQTTRGMLPGMAVGILDSQLRTVAGFARGRVLYGREVAELPHARSVLTGAFTDLLIGDALATIAARSLHLLPDETSVSTAAAKYLVPKLLREADYRLSVLLGARSYLREGPHAVFQKNSRDLQLLTFGHANATVCQATLVPQLPRLAQRSWAAETAVPAPARLFRFTEALPELDYHRLQLTSRGADSLSAVLGTPVDAPGPARLAALFLDELRELKERVGALGALDRTVVAGRRGFLLADRYAVVLAAASCLGIWQQADAAADPFLADPAWLTAALHRLAVRLGRTGQAPDEGAHDRLLAELLARVDTSRSLDLAGRTLHGHRPDRAR
ncbi:acyl-CoA dehydrogenase [Kitasatospora sp. NPDC018619]|uniref:acyl-CoA dehydrogenase n=1 Tax=unclassified Kitasatospora TaxID=2633591 RepID=UPI0037B1E243